MTGAGAVALRVAYSIVVIGGSGLAAPSAVAETLTDAMASAYSSNPTLDAERARLRAIDEGVPQALSGWRPTVTANGDYAHTRTTTRPRSGVDSRDPHGYSVTLRQPIFSGFKTIEGTAQAEANVDAGRQSLVNTEQTTLLDAVTVYMDVVRDQAVLDLRMKNVSVLNEQLRASRARFDVGEITRTDVAQSEARLSGATSARASAQAVLASSRARYRQVVGRAPGTLRYPKSIAARLPKTLDQAVAIARQNNPQLLAATFAEEASRHAIEVARGDLLPEVSLDAEYSRDYEPSRTFDRVESTTVLGRVTVPIYESGIVYSRVREAMQINSQQRLLIVESDRLVVASVVSAWENLRASREQIRSDQSQVDANSLALEGVRQEALVGSRTTLDVLDAEQEYLDSQVSLVGSRRNEVVASYQLLSAIGRLTAEYLRLPVEHYDPTRHYDSVRGKWIGFGSAGSD
jgi:outer membrane protein